MVEGGERRGQRGSKKGNYRISDTSDFYSMKFGLNTDCPEFSCGLPQSQR
jgi:hypothetical protein